MGFNQYVLWTIQLFFTNFIFKAINNELNQKFQMNSDLAIIDLNSYHATFNKKSRAGGLSRPFGSNKKRIGKKAKG